MSHYAYSERSRNAMTGKFLAAQEKSKRKRKEATAQTSWPTIPCCDAMRAGLQCDCCEVVDA